ncbi:MAG: TIGR00300 family protein, partial [Actinomycetota bacterium]|nr:TIGR00300 family protein [Actinomycetota bacterium]
MTASEVVELEGHIIDSLILAKVMDVILAAGADYRVVDVVIGRTNADTSKARLEVIAADEAALTPLLVELQTHGANPAVAADAELVPCDQDGVLPAGFYSTTNLPTAVRVDRQWVDVDNPEMDCAIVVTTRRGGRGDRHRARSVPMHRVRAGDLVVVGFDGVRVAPLEKPRGSSPFEFMNSEVSSEKPKSLLVGRVAERVGMARDAGSRILAVCGPAVVHTGAAPPLARLVKAGWIDVLFAGNGFAAHDIEANVMGTSLGVSVREGTGSEGG